MGHTQHTSSSVHVGASNHPKPTLRSDTLMVGTKKGLFTLKRTNDRWEIIDVEFLGDPVTAGVTSGDTRWIALGTGHFGTHIWRHGGGADARWVEVAAPTYPARPADAADVSPMTQQPWPWTLQVAWTLELGLLPGTPATVDDGELTDQSLWCGTIPGGLFFSPDGGATWSLNRPLWEMPERAEWSGGGYDWPGVHSVLVHPTNPLTVLVAVSCGGGWITDDGGSTWTVTEGMRNEYMPPGLEYSPNAQDPHRLARCAAQPDVVWNQHHNGCFRSVDGGRHWHEIDNRPPSRFGFAVAAHPTEPDVAWFVPAIKDEMRVPVDGKMVVCRTDDGGKSFSSFGAGLPDTHAYDLVYRHAFDVDSSGDQLAMASTTGSLWCSGSAGESWYLVSANLPPVYFVRFV